MAGHAISSYAGPSSGEALRDCMVAISLPPGGTAARPGREKGDSPPPFIPWSKGQRQGPGRVAQLVRASSQHAKFAGLNLWSEHLQGPTNECSSLKINK